ncbi:MAG: sigma-70 family RNA polymerase sigma factor [Nanoarchaeota archaeon]
MKKETVEISRRAEEDLTLVKVLQNKKASNREKQKAFEQLYSRHQSQMTFHFQKSVKDKDVAEDLKMITFEKIHSNIGSYNPKLGVFSTWMYKIALNTLIDHKRKDKYEVLSLDAIAGKTSEENEGMEFQIKSTAFTPEEELIRFENAKTVRSAIESIDSENIRRIMTYRFIDELSFEEIAVLEGVEKDNSTLRVNVMRGQSILKEKIKIHI